MNVQFLRKFSADLDKINQPKDRQAIRQVIESVKTADVLTSVSGVKKLVGFNDAYRIRAGNYRIGVFLDGETVQFARVAHRKDIYRVFP